MKYLSRKSVWIMFCFIISIIFIYPLFTNELVIGHDTLFHLCRIEALKNAYMNGDIFPKLYYYQNFNFGYASPLFYSDIFLALPALLCMLGVSLVVSYKIFLFLCTFASAITMFWATKKITNNISTSYLSSLFYTFVAYRVTDVYVRGAMGEVIAMIFIPVAIYAIFNVLFEEKPNFLYLTISFSGLLLSHNITFLFLCFVFGILIIIHAKKIIMEKKRLISIIIAILFSIGILSFFLFPMLELLLSGGYAINEFVADSNLSNYTLFFEQLFTININFGLAGHEFGRSYWMTTNTGPIVLFLSVLYPFLSKGKSDEYSYLNSIFFIGIISVVLCLNIIPWEYLNNFLSFLQFPWRLMIIGCSLLSIVAAVTVTLIVEKYRIKYLAIAIIILTVGIGTYQLSFINKQETKIYNDIEYSLISDDSYSGKHGIVTYYNQAELAAADYLPIKDNVDYRNYGDYVRTNNSSKIENFIRGYNLISFTVENSNVDSLYVLPLIYYKGYIVDVFNENGEVVDKIAPFPDSETHLVAFKTNESYDNYTYKIYYKGTKIQTLSVFVTLIFLLFIGIIIYTRRKK